MAVHELFAYLCVPDARAAIEYYCGVFGAKERFRLEEPGSGRIGHAELDLGRTTLMLADEHPEAGVQAPDPEAPHSVIIHLHVDDADEVIERAVAAGGTRVRPVQDAFYGERSGVIRCPFGHRWLIGHDIEHVAAEEMQRRWDQLG